MPTPYDTSIVVFLVIALICTDSSNPHWSTVMGWASAVITCLAFALLGGVLYVAWVVNTEQTSVWTDRFFQYTTEICYLQTVLLWLVVPVIWVSQRNNMINYHWEKRKVYFMGSSSLLVLRKLLLVLTCAVLFSSQLFISDAVTYFFSVVLPTERLTDFTPVSPMSSLIPAHLFFTLTTGVGYMFVTRKMSRC